MEKIPLRETLVVEGKYDKQKLSALFDTWVIAVGGFRIFQDQALLDTIRRAAHKTGIILLTDADGAGLVIRNFIQGAVGGQYIKHAYTPQVPGREKRKRVPGKEGLLGVEGIADDVLIDCVLRAAPQEGGLSAADRTDPLTRFDLYELGLSGGAGSAEKRKTLLAHCGLPVYLSTSAMLDALRCLYGKEELFDVCTGLFEEGGGA